MMKMSYCLMVVMMAAPVNSPIFSGSIQAGEDAGRRVVELGGQVAQQSATHAANEFKIAGINVADHTANRSHEVLRHLGQCIGQTGEVVQGGIQGLNGAIGNALQGVREIHDDALVSSVILTRAGRAGAEAINETLEDELLRSGKRVAPKAPVKEERQFIDINFEAIKDRLSQLLRIANKHNRRVDSAITSKTGINLTEARKSVLDGSRLEGVSPEDFCRWVGSIEGSVDDWRQSLLALGMCAPWGWGVDDDGDLVKQEIESNHSDFLDYVNLTFSEVFKKMYPVRSAVPMLTDGSSSSGGASSSRIKAVEDDQPGSSTDAGSSTDTPTTDATDIRDDSSLLTGLTNLCMYLTAHDRSIDSKAIDALINKHDAETAMDIANLPWVSLLVDYVQNKKSLIDEMRPKVLEESNRDVQWFDPKGGSPALDIHNLRIMQEGVTKANKAFLRFLSSKMSKSDAENFKRDANRVGNIVFGYHYSYTNCDGNRINSYENKSLSPNAHRDIFIGHAAEIAEQPFSLKDAHYKLSIGGQVKPLAKEYLLLNHELAYLNEIVAKAKTPASSKEQLKETMGEAKNMFDYYWSQKEVFFKEIYDETKRYFGVQEQAPSALGITDGQSKGTAYGELERSASAASYVQTLIQSQESSERLMSLMQGAGDVKDRFLMQYYRWQTLQDAQAAFDPKKILGIIEKVRPTEEQVKEVTAEVDQMVQREVGIASSTFAEMKQKLDSEAPTKPSRKCRKSRSWKRRGN